MSRYQIIYFVPDPFHDGRVPIGALVQSKHQAKAVIASRLPGTECLGGPKVAALMRMILRDLGNVNQFELPNFISPHVCLESECLLPPQIEDPFDWVQKNVLPHVPEDKKPQKAGASTNPHRSTIGYKFLQSYKVDKYVNRTFVPGQDWNCWLQGGESILERISHWAASKHQILLLEPIVPGDSRVDFDVEVKKVSQRFLSYKGFLSTAPPSSDKKGSLVAYILPGISQSQKAKAFASLERASDEVLDLAEVKARSDFFERMQALYEANKNPTLLM